MSSTHASPAILELDGHLDGAVFTADDAGYAPEIAAFNTAVVHTPDVVVAAASAADVALALRFARQHGHRVTVQTTGHGAHTPIAGGLLISTRRLDQVSIDVASRIATIGGGARWAAVIAAAAPHGLAPVAGSSVTVGVTGYLLGGGLGPLARSHGFGSDYLVGLTVVTGAGEVVEASAQQNPDLFWALRGGKAGLGVVTELRLRLIELPALYAGALYFDEPHIEAALRAWIDWKASAPAQVSTSVAIVRVPPLEAIPAPLRGRLLLALRFAYPGAEEEGARLAAPLRAAAPVHLDALGALPIADVARIHNDPPEPGPSAVVGMLLAAADQDLASVLLEHAGPGRTTPFIVVELRHLGAATARDVAGGSAVGGRGAGFTLALIGVDPALFATEIPAASSRVTAAVRPWISAETNINFAGEPHSAAEFARAWPPATLARLREIRRRYDPDGVLPYGF